MSVHSRESTADRPCAATYALPSLTFGCDARWPVPGEDACHALWDAYAMPEHIRAHSTLVAGIAGALADLAVAAGMGGVHPATVRASGLLHDIGTYFLLKQDGSDGEPLKFDGPHYVQHGLKGYEYLLNEGVDESIAQFARNHTGVGLTRETVESQGLPLPPADYVPMNLEQEVVMVADKYNSKSIPPKFLTAEAYTRKAARFGESNKREWLRLLERYGVLDVKPLAEQYHMRIAE